jgi:CRP-like cAMP-binding protein
MSTSIHSNKLLQALRRFAPLSQDEFEMILPHVEIKLLQKGDHFVSAGRYSEFAGYVLSGQLRQFYQQQDKELTTYFYFEDMLVADYVGGIKKLPAALSIEALSPVEILSFPITALYECYQKNNAWNQVGRCIAEYIAIGLEERMVDLLSLNAEQRYNKLLESNKRRILERIPQQYVANYLGITPVSFSRLRNAASKK